MSIDDEMYYQQRIYELEAERDAARELLREADELWSLGYGEGIADALGWDGSPGELYEALLYAGYIVDVGKHRNN